MSPHSKGWLVKNHFELTNLLKSPAHREIIARWTRGGGGHDLALEQPPDPNRFSFLALGDTGDSESSGPGESPQDAVARFLSADAALPGSPGAGDLVLHVGDVIYMTGEQRLYDRNFRRPYAPLLAPGSTVDNLVFRLPFLPVPGNHDYYDLSRWARALSHAPGLGAGIRTIARELFAYSLSEGGSDQGRAYMESFVAREDRPDGQPLPYQAGVLTRIPNRYYRFRYGSVDFFALDSNTLDPPPPSEKPAEREEGARHVKQLARQAAVLEEELLRDQRAAERWVANHRTHMVHDGVPVALRVASEEVTVALHRLTQAIVSLEDQSTDCEPARQAAQAAAGRWEHDTAQLARASRPDAMLKAIARLDQAADQCCAACRKLDACLAFIPEGPARTEALEASDEVGRAVREWGLLANGEPPAELCRRLHELAEAGLDAQRELARERHRARYQTEDYDVEQLRWLDESLEVSIRERPDAWRVVYLHHPLFSTIANHCEHPDVQGVRANLLARLQGRAHLVLAGHSHAFEWIRCRDLPHTGIVVTGGGGQVSLRRSVLDPRRFHRYRNRYDALRRNGVAEVAVAGRGPSAIDGASGSIYHYLRIDVSEDALIVRPVGVRRVRSVYRREEPMPAFHAYELPDGQPPWEARQLRAVVVRRDRPPYAEWTS